MNGLEKAATVCTVVVALGAVATSATGLLKVAELAEFPQAGVAGVSVPIGGIGLIGFVDGTAFAAGLMRRARKMWEATVLMAAAVLVSMATQAVAEVVEALELHPGETAKGWPVIAFIASMHVLGPLFAWGISEALLKFLRPEAGKQQQPSGRATNGSTTTRSARTAAGATPSKPSVQPAQGGVPAGGAPPTPGATAEAGRKGEGRSVPTAPPPPSVPQLALVPDPLSQDDIDLSRQISDWLDEHRLDPIKARVQDAHEALFGGRPGGPRSDRILRLVRQYRETHAITPQESRG